MCTGKDEGEEQKREQEEEKEVESSKKSWKLKTGERVLYIEIVDVKSRCLREKRAVRKIHKVVKCAEGIIVRTAQISYENIKGKTEWGMDQ